MPSPCITMRWVLNKRHRSELSQRSRDGQASRTGAARAQAVQSAFRPVRAGGEGPGNYVKWLVELLFITVPAQAIVAQHIQSFQEFPPRQEPGSVSVGGNTLAKSA